MRKFSILLTLAYWLGLSALGQVQGEKAEAENVKMQHTFLMTPMSFRGYSQFRYNQLGATNPEVRSEQGDKSIGDGNGFFMRRARLVFFGQPTERAFIYIQPDLASTPSSSGPTHILQLRDLYCDLFLTKDQSLRIRLGQSKVPFGFENLQSSQNRIALDRNDALNTAVKDERDIGGFLYWASPEIRQRFRLLVQKGLKGSGDYGVFGIGVYNGQLANQSEANSSLHIVSRITYPFLFSSGQFVEASLQAYKGRYVVKRSEGVGGARDSLEQRFAASLVVYPQPFGLQMEYNQGKGPEFDPQLNSIEIASLHGGYILAHYKYNEWIPFLRHHFYRGGRKFITNSPRYSVDETEIGVEWQIDKSLEFTGMYVWSKRSNVQDPTRLEEGRLVRLQMQWNY